MTNTFGKYFRITTWGESHGKAIGVVADGVKPGLKISEAEIQKELDRRRPGQSKVVTQRQETDKIEILSGIFEGKTTGMPISLVIWNKDQKPGSYEKIKNLFRPGHAGYTWLQKYGIYDYRGGGRSSARETANWVSSGAIAKKILAEKGIKIVGYVKQIGNIKADNIDYNEIRKNPVNCPDRNAAKKIERLLLKTKKEGDSLGAIIEVAALNVPAGLGDPVFDKLDANIAKALMSINAVKGVEIGAGFSLALMKGSESNDAFIRKNGKIMTKTNNSGGILGGVSNGMPIVARIAVKPTSSILKSQETLTLQGKKAKISVEGRHDPCVGIRAVPIAEAMMANVLADAFLRQENLMKNRKNK